MVKSKTSALEEYIGTTKQKRNVGESVRMVSAKHNAKTASDTHKWKLHTARTKTSVVDGEAIHSATRLSVLHSRYWKCPLIPGNE